MCGNICSIFGFCRDGTGLLRVLDSMPTTRRELTAAARPLQRAVIAYSVQPYSMLLCCRYMSCHMLAMLVLPSSAACSVCWLSLCSARVLFSGTPTVATVLPSTLLTCLPPPPSLLRKCLSLACLALLLQCAGVDPVCLSGSCILSKLALVHSRSAVTTTVLLARVRGLLQLTSAQTTRYTLNLTRPFTPEKE